MCNDRRMRILVGGTVAALLVAVVVGVFTLGGGGTSLADAAERVQGMSLRSDVTMSMVVEGTPVEMKGKLLASADTKRTRMDLEGAGMKQTLIVVNGDLWMGGPAFEDALPKGKRWVLVEDGARTSLDTMSFDELMTFLEGATDVEERGKTEIDGVRVTHHAGTVDLKAALEKAGEDLADHADLLKQSPVMPIECWIDDEGNPVRIKTGMTVDGSKVEMTVDNLELGAPVDVDAPPADETISAEEAGIPIDG